VDFIWLVENFIGDKNIVFTSEDAGIKDVIKIDYCQNCVIKIETKVKGILLNKCQKVYLIFKNTISNVDIMHSNSIEVWS